MKRLKRWSQVHRVFWKRVRSDIRGQDLIEYALMTAVVAVASVAVLPGATSSISQIFSKMGSVLSSAGGS